MFGISSCTKLVGRSNSRSVVGFFLLAVESGATNSRQQLRTLMMTSSPSIHGTRQLLAATTAPSFFNSLINEKKFLSTTPDTVNVEDSQVIASVALDEVATTPDTVTTTPELTEIKVMGTRLSTYIADTNLLSRREAERLIRAKRVTVNGQIQINPAMYVDTPDSSHPLIEIDGVQIRRIYPQGISYPRLWAVMKMKHEIMSDSDPQKSRSLLMDRIRHVLLPEVYEKYNGQLKPIYRLDYMIEGLALLTNSGELARILQHQDSPVIANTTPLGAGSHASSSSGGSSKQPNRNKPAKPGQPHDYSTVYRVRCHGLITESKLEGLRRGLYIDGKKYQGLNITVQRTSNTISWLLVTCKDKQPRAIQKCFQSVYLDITRMICVGYGPYRVDDLFPTGSTHGVIECKLDPKINAQYLRWLNAKMSRTSFVK